MPATVVPATARDSTKKKPAKNTRGQLNFRVKPEVLSLFDQAAELTGKNRTDFVLDAARQAAQQALLDQVHIRLKPDAFAAFLELLDAPPRPNENLRKTMQTPAPWE